MCYNLNESGGHYTKWNKLVIKKQIPAWFHLYEVFKAVKLLESRMAVSRNRGQEDRELFNGTEFQFFKMEKLQRSVCTTMSMWLTLLYCILKNGKDSKFHVFFYHNDKKWNNADLLNKWLNYFILFQTKEVLNSLRYI